MQTQYDVIQIANSIRDAKNLCGSVRVIAIDGPTGSGKTTLTNALLAELKDSVAIRMDDIFGSWTPDFFAELPDRMIDQILAPLAAGKQPEYQKYDWHEKAFTQIVSIPQASFLILDGVGSANPKLKPYLAYSIWIEANKADRLERSIARDGEQLRSEITDWQGHEDVYFSQLQVRQSADLHLIGD